MCLFPSQPQKLQKRLEVFLGPRMGEGPHNVQTSQLHPHNSVSLGLSLPGNCSGAGKLWALSQLCGMLCSLLKAQ